MKLPLAYQHVVNSYTKRSHANNELFRHTRLDKSTKFCCAISEESPNFQETRNV